MAQLAIINKTHRMTNLAQELHQIGADPVGLAIMQPKFEQIILKIFDVATTSAMILKQEMLSKGGEVATPRNMITGKISHGDILIAGTLNQYTKLIEKLKIQPFGLKSLAVQIEKILRPEKLPTLTIRKTRLDFNQRPFLMGILNITPDSFSDGGKYLQIDEAITHAEHMIHEGADIIDIGGQSTRPGAQNISAEDEIKRVIPIIKQLRKISQIPLSIDTYHAQVAKHAIDAGVDIINDISGLNFDPNMAQIAGESGIPVVLMHIQGTPLTMQQNPQYTNLIRQITAYFEHSIELALKAGVKPTHIILDPGIGFGKSMEHNLQIIHNLSELKTLGFPLLVGTSKKSFIGKLLDDEINERLIGTVVTNTIALVNGANIIRVHDVRELKETIIITQAILHAKGGA